MNSNKREGVVVHSLFSPQRLTPLLAHHTVTHKRGIGNVAGDILNEFTVIVGIG